jgi:hypothetical protein
VKPKKSYKGDITKPSGYDSCQTPPYALEPLLPYLNQRYIVWEPARGEGLLATAINDAGFRTIGTDITEGLNFFEYEPQDWHCIITNPPYSIKYEWIQHCYDLEKAFALLVPLETMGAAKAQKMFKKYGAKFLLLDKRVNFKMPDKGWGASGAQFPVMWLTWQLPLPDTITYGHIESNKYAD